jgi:hypothetical protein
LMSTPMMILAAGVLLNESSCTRWTRLRFDEIEDDCRGVQRLSLRPFGRQCVRKPGCVPFGNLAQPGSDPHGCVVAYTLIDGRAAAKSSPRVSRTVFIDPAAHGSGAVYGRGKWTYAKPSCSCEVNLKRWKQPSPLWRNWTKQCSPLQPDPRHGVVGRAWDPRSAWKLQSA